MRLTMNAATERRLKDSLGDAPGWFKLNYDTQDCGCNGVLVLDIISAPLRTDVPVEAGDVNVVVDRQQEQQFDEVLRLAADSGYPSYKCSSDASLYSTNVRIRDLRGAGQAQAAGPKVSCGLGAAARV